MRIVLTGTQSWGTAQKPCKLIVTDEKFSLLVDQDYGDKRELVSIRRSDKYRTHSIERRIDCSGQPNTVVYFGGHFIESNFESGQIQVWDQHPHALYPDIRWYKRTRWGQPWHTAIECFDLDEKSKPIWDKFFAELKGEAPLQETLLDA